MPAVHFTKLLIVVAAGFLALLALEIDVRRLRGRTLRVTAIATADRALSGAEHVTPAAR